MIHMLYIIYYILHFINYKSMFKSIDIRVDITIENEVTSFSMVITIDNRYIYRYNLHMGEYSNTETLTINHHNFIISQLNISKFYL